MGNRASSKNKYAGGLASGQQPQRARFLRKGKGLELGAELEASQQYGGGAHLEHSTHKQQQYLNSSHPTTTTTGRLLPGHNRQHLHAPSLLSSSTHELSASQQHIWPQQHKVKTRRQQQQQQVSSSSQQALHAHINQQHLNSRHNYLRPSGRLHSSSRQLVQNQLNHRLAAELYQLEGGEELTYPHAAEDELEDQLAGYEAAAQPQHEHYPGALGGSSSGQTTYRSTPLASSSSSSHSTAPVSGLPDPRHAYEHHLQALYSPPTEHELYECDFGPAQQPLDDPQLGLLTSPAQGRLFNPHQIATPPTRCLDSCCNAAPSFSATSNQRALLGAGRANFGALAANRAQGPKRAFHSTATAASKSASKSAASQQQTARNSSGGVKMNGVAKQQQQNCATQAGALERGLALDANERKRLGLLGLLPAVVQDQELQARAVMNFIENCQDELGKYVYLRNLKDFNERLFYFTLTRNVEKLMPLVYTPTVGLACQKFSEIYMRPRGMWVSAQDAGRVKQVVENWPERDVRVIVVTDGERILGLGDLGANGMGISIGKLSLYTALAGISPQNVLPVTLDVGTNNQQFLADPFYIGLRQARLRGEPYEQLVEEFMRAVSERWGRSCLIQFEDFANSTAFDLLKRYRRDYCTFNDDIQGTASVALAGLITAARQTTVGGGKRLSDCNFLFYGAGEANLGTAQLLIMAMLDEGATREEAKRRIWLVDSKGLVVKSRTDLNEHKAELAQQLKEGTNHQLKELEEIIDLVKPLAIIGASAQGGSFTQAICKKMAQYNERPIIFALSNPTSKAECTASQAYEWTQGKCVFASGSPFEPVEFGGKKYVTGQGNNAYIFPGVGLAAIGAHTHIIPEETFLVAARALSDQVTQEDLDVGLVYPSLTKIREVTLRVATRVLEFFYAERLATYRPEPSDKQEFLKAIQYDPRY